MGEKMTKITGIKEVDFDKFIQRLNEADEYAVATQTHHKDGIWYAIIYHKQGESPITARSSKEAITSPLFSTHPPATKSQITALKKHGYKGDTSKLTKQEAYKLIKEGVKKK